MSRGNSGWRCEDDRRPGPLFAVSGAHLVCTSTRLAAVLGRPRRDAAPLQGDTMSDERKAQIVRIAIFVYLVIIMGWIVASGLAFAVNLMFK